MNFRKLVVLTLSLSLVVGLTAEAKDYRNKYVGNYSNAATDIGARENNVTFLAFMKNTLYPLIKSQASSQTPYYVEHLDDISNGIGAELKLAPDVTTYHVKYAGPFTDKADRSGRSFGVVHETAIEANKKVDYIADASYSFYLTELEKVLKNEEQAQIFFETIFRIVINTDASGFQNPKMSKYTKRVAADFVAVYVAEQYRRLLKYDGQYANYSPAAIQAKPWRKNARRKPWDGAHLQVTILANFHAGQTKKKRGMFFAGNYMTDPYNQISKIGGGQKVCAYELLTNRWSGDDDQADLAWQRPFKLKDYWQFGTECGGRSGVNVTRSDFTKLGREITYWMNDNGFRDDLNEIWTASEKTIGTRKNVIDAISHKIINDNAPESFQNPEALVQALVKFAMSIREQANAITDDIQ